MLDLTVEKKIILTLKQVYAVRTMLDVEMVHKTQTAIASTVRGVMKESVRITQETPDKLNPNVIVQIADNTAGKLASTSMEYMREWNDLDRPLIRSVELAGYAEASLEPTDAEKKVACFLNNATFDKLKNVVLSGKYNSIRVTDTDADAESEGGAALGKVLMEARAGIIEAFNAAEVPAQGVGGVFTFTQPMPAGTLLN